MVRVRVRVRVRARVRARVRVRVMAVGNAGDGARRVGHVVMTPGRSQDVRCPRRDWDV